jgi:hypothetical protein
MDRAIASQNATDRSRKNSACRSHGFGLQSKAATGMTSFAPAHNIKDRRHDSRHHGLSLGRRTPRLRAPQIETPTRPLNPDPQAWTDDDLAAALSRTMRWGGASRWEHPLSVAQHSLTVLTIREADGALTPGEALRELLHDATEFMLGWDCITPLKAQLGETVPRP